MALPNTPEGQQLEAISRGYVPELTRDTKPELVYLLKSIINDEYIILAEVNDRLDALHELEGKLGKIKPIDSSDARE